jgi:predicted dehydrogenase
MKTDSKTAKSKIAKVSRRDFLNRTAAATAAFTIVPRYVLGARDHTAPSEKLNVAVIGAGGQGRHNVNALLSQSDVQVTAICDVTEQADYSRFYYGGVAGRGPVKKLIDDSYKGKPATIDYVPCASHIDFRKMFEIDKSIDAVLIATPDHAHAAAALAAIDRGKHVYCEKPLAHSIYETRKVTEAARKAGVATQMGNHGHSSETIRITCEWIWDGAIGDVTEVHAWSHTGLGWTDYRTKRPEETQPVPAGMDWDLWLGPAEKRPYNIAYAPYNWRGWWDFGTGAIGDMACHNMDPAFWALKLGHPYSVEASATNINPETTPFGSIVHYKFGARGDMPPVKVTWYSGGLMPPRPEELEPGRQLTGGGNGILFVGTKGKLMADGWGGSPRLIPEKKMKEYKLPAKTLSRSKGHHREWIDACKGGKQPHGGFDYSGPMTEVILLGNVALRTKQKLTWNAKEMKATNSDDAEQYIKPIFHNGWTI